MGNKNNFLWCNYYGFGLKSTSNFKLMIENNLQIKNLSPVELELIRQSQDWPIYAYTYITFLSIIFFCIRRELKPIKKELNVMKK